MSIAERQRVIAHVDMDAFFAAVEQRDNPALLGQPVVIGGLGNRGVVSTASYAARKFGVHSAMPIVEARRRCPHAHFILPRMSVYSGVSAQIMEIFRRFSPDIQPLSLDEAFIDLTGTERVHGDPILAMERLRAMIRDELNLTASVGLAPNKFVAKVASDLDKPDGLTVCQPGEVLAFLDPLPIRRIWGVGPKAAESLERFGLATIGDIARMPIAEMQRLFGDFGSHIWRLANGVDDRPVATSRTRKSLGEERTLSSNVRGFEAVRRLLLPIADSVARSLRKRNLQAGTVRVKIKTADFKLHTRERRLSTPAADSVSFMEAAELLLQRIDLSRPIRLIGLAATQLVSEDQTSQQGLFAQSKAKTEKLERALDAVKDRYGTGAVVRAGARPLRAATPANKPRED